MVDVARSYGESSKQRKSNGKKLRAVRVRMGLTIKQAAQALGLKNAAAIANAESVCSTELYKIRLEQYRSLEQSSLQNSSEVPRLDHEVSSTNDEAVNHHTISVSAKSKERRMWSNLKNGECREQNNQSAVTSIKLLEIAIKRLAQAEKKSETDVWLDLFSEVQLY